MAQEVAHLQRLSRKSMCVLANSRYTASLVQPYAHLRLAVSVLHPPIEALPDPEPEALVRLAGLIGSADGRCWRVLVVSSLARASTWSSPPCQDLRQRFAGVTLAIAGDGPDRARLMQLAQDKGVGDCVIFLGRVDKAMRTALLSSADLFVMPARRAGLSVEGYGIVYAEAAWYGVPSVAGAEGGGAEAVMEGETGCVVAGDDAAAVRGASNGCWPTTACAGGWARRRGGGFGERERGRPASTAYLDALHAAPASSNSALTGSGLIGHAGWDYQTAGARA